MVRSNDELEKQSQFVMNAWNFLKGYKDDDDFKKDEENMFFLEDYYSYSFRASHMSKIDVKQTELDQ